MAIVTAGFDLAKNVFAVHGVDVTGKPALFRPAVARGKLAETIADLAPCLSGMEACPGAHHWARLFQSFGHSVRLMAPKFVAPYRLSGKRGKNDAADAAASQPHHDGSAKLVGDVRQVNLSALPRLMTSALVMCQATINTSFNDRVVQAQGPWGVF